MSTRALLVVFDLLAALQGTGQIRSVVYDKRCCLGPPAIGQYLNFVPRFEGTAPMWVVATNYNL